MPRYRVTVDTGGTFNDFVYLEEASGRLEVWKVSSTPQDPSEAVASGIQHLLERGAEPGEIVFFSHGTTVGTNALLEEKGVRTGLLVTAGFRGIYEVQEQMRGYGPAAFDFWFGKPRLLARPRDTFEVPERVDARGNVIQPLREADALRLAEQVRQSGVESLAVCLLFSFRNPTHERLLKQVLERCLPDVPISISSEVLPQIREYYRLSTTVINAYLRPILARYLGRLESRLHELGLRTPQQYLMQSNGGVASFGAGAERAVTTLLSGPAGGVMAGMALGRAAGVSDLVTFDMGGTSCDVALIQHGRPTTATLTKIGGRDVAVPMLDINTVSAGGGTIARVEPAGDLLRLRVGPDSAGARPGPVCYGQGGTHPTITDADLVLGYLNPDNFLGGRMQLDRSLAEQAVSERIARPLGLDTFRAAEGIVRIIDVKMEEAIKAISTRRGYDLRDFTLVAFGGAGPVHASRVARELGMRGVLVPLFPGVTSAMGLLMADVRHDHVRSRLDPIHALQPESAEAIFDDLEREARAQLASEGFGAQDMALERQVDLRYAGQGYEVTVSAPPGPWDPAVLHDIRHRFDAQHEQQFGHKAEDEVVEVVNYRVVGLGMVPKVELARQAPAAVPVSTAQVSERQAYFPELGGLVSTPIYDRTRLAPGHELTGPAIVEQLDSTTLILPGQHARVDDYLNVLVTQSHAPAITSPATWGET
jgi:N-methylhydantoinase A